MWHSPELENPIIWRYVPQLIPPVMLYIVKHFDKYFLSQKKLLNTKWKKYPKNMQVPIIDDRLPDRPDRGHGSSQKPDRTCDDVGKRIGQCFITGF